ncbi:NAD-dependent epimerase/dehydratase family protein [Vibrio tritonius]|uniref:NAD-dependent epimerase/dehydratase family protein n=1 Tax=Vibrio tritonius TaxID=1435069 RepID=UPI00083922FB|nr:NAD(P)-dependent oxidoreductase [Vibrio tritonius]
MKRITVIGSSGFIGSAVRNKFQLEGYDVYAPARHDLDFSLNLGIIIYCAGYGDCNRPNDVLDANINYLRDILDRANFEKLIYLSSTRVYMGSNSANESSDLVLEINDNRKLFNLTKLVAEDLCLNSNKNTIVVRPSNVYGLALNSSLFLPSIIKDAINKNVVNMYVDKTYSKDYVSVLDVVDIIFRLSMTNNEFEVYNIASGENVTAEDIASILVSNTGCKVIWHDNNVTDVFPVTSISRLKYEFNYKPSCVLSDLKMMILDYKREIGRDYCI